MDKKLYGTYTRLEYSPESGPQAMMNLVIKGINRLAKKMSVWDIVPDFDTMQFIVHLQEKHKYDFDWYLEDEEPQKEEVKHIMTVGVKFHGEPRKKSDGPMRPIVAEDFDGPPGFYFNVCPSCRMLIDYQENPCSHCGQELKWEE